MSVAEMLAAARGEVAGASAAKAEKPAAKAPAAKKPAAGKPPAKAAAEAKKPAGPKDTMSILAAARSSAKPGPMSKAEAAAKAKTADAPAKTKPSAPPMPSKPDYAKVAPARASETAERRGFLVACTAIFAGTFFLTSSLAIGFSSLAVTSLLWVLGLARFMFPNILTEPPTVFKVGFPDEYAPGQVATKFKAQFGVWVVRYEYDGQALIYALQSVCTHLGCTPNWLEGEQKFKCPCHGSGFYKDGVNFEGPAPRPLERFAIRLSDDGQLEVDKSRKFKEEVGQWVDPASYVSV
jgi:cytochrome b6-f complex iron-sulfur subunit